MSVRVVSRICPLLDKELDKDIIVRPESAETGKPNTIVKIPNPKNEAEEFSFTFNGVYDQMTSQETLFACEVQPHLKSLFQGYDVTIFAYGVTGMGKTYTMRGGLKLADRGVIPRLLSGIFRRGKRIVRDTCSRTTVRVTLSYYEIYNDRFFDLLEPPERCTPAGLPLRAEANGRTVVAGLSERACEDLGDFEKLYIEANNNRVTAATKLNAHSSRSHAILRVKLTQTTDDSVLESTASAIDLAGSEDNRRTDNGRERLVESAAINKSLFVLSQCIEAIARGDKRIPYRESKMTRILSLGQNRGITVMILNLAPLRSYHLDTLSSLNVSSRAKRIEVREIENEVVFKQMPQATTVTAPGAGVIARQPLRPLPNAQNTHHGNPVAAGHGSGKASDTGRPVKAFNVYADRTTRPSALPQTRPSVVGAVGHHQTARPSMHKRPPEHDAASRLTKAARPAATISAAAIEAMVEKVCEILVAQSAARPASSPEAGISDAVQRRLEALERRIESEERRGDGKSDGLRLLLAARQYKEAGEEAAALYAYEAALPYFPSQSKLLSKIERLRARLGLLAATDDGADCGRHVEPPHKAKRRAVTGESTRCQQQQLQADTNAVCQRADGHEPCSGDATGVIEDMPCRFKPSATKSRRPASTGALSAITTASLSATKERHEGRTGKQDCAPASQRTRQLLDVVNSRDPALIRGLVGFGAKCARDLMDYLEDDAEGAEARCIATLDQLRALPGMGSWTVERAYQGLAAAT